ncbi:MAG: helix-turn-helix domain-containing protein [Xanthomonadales bacterium]|nr:helix-turn-helix domain-containing protein [Xanthomonadales bacterium]
MTDESVFKKYLDSKKQKNYWIERVKNQFAVSVERFVDFRMLKKKDLAERMDVSRPYITKILRGDANLTLETIGRLAYALDAEVTINLSPKESQIKPWLYAIEGKSRPATKVGAVNTSNQKNSFPANEHWGSQVRNY